MTAGKPCAQRTATPRNARAGRPSCQETTAWSSTGSSYPRPSRGHRPSPVTTKRRSPGRTSPSLRASRSTNTGRLRDLDLALERAVLAPRASRPRPGVRRTLPRESRYDADRLDVREPRSRRGRRRRSSAASRSGGGGGRVGRRHGAGHGDSPDSPAAAGLLPRRRRRGYAVSTLIRFVVPGMFTAVPAVMTTRSPEATMPGRARGLEGPWPRAPPRRGTPDVGGDDAPLDRELLRGVALVRRGDHRAARTVPRDRGGRAPGVRRDEDRLRVERLGDVAGRVRHRLADRSRTARPDRCRARAGSRGSARRRARSGPSSARSRPGTRPTAVSPESITADVPSRIAFATSLASARVGSGVGDHRLEHLRRRDRRLARARARRGGSASGRAAPRPGRSRRRGRRGRPSPRPRAAGSRRGRRPPRPSRSSRSPARREPASWSSSRSWRTSFAERTNESAT